MFPFRFTKASDESSALAAAASGARYIAGGTTLIDLMRETVERPCSRRRHQRTAVPRHRPAAVEIARRFAGTDVGVGRPPRCAGSVPGHRTSAGVVGVGADPQHGVDRRQPDAAPALPVLPRCVGRLQPACTRLRLRRDRRPQPHPCDPRDERRVCRHPPVRLGGGIDRARRRGDHARRQRGAPDSRSRTSSAGPAAHRIRSTTWARAR